MARVTRWWWVRHAPVVGDYQGTLYGALDVPCDTSDAAAFARLGAGLPAHALWLTSHLSRTQATARAAQAAMGVRFPMQAEAALGEQDFGHWQGLTWDGMKAADPAVYKAFWKDPINNAPPGGESFAHMMDRVAAAVDRLTAEHAGQDIIAVTHGGTIRAAVGQALGLTSERAMAVQVDNLSLTRLDHIAGGTLGGRGGAWRVGTVNRLP